MIAISVPYLFRYLPVEQALDARGPRPGVSTSPPLDQFWLYLDAEVLVLPPVLYPQDFCFVGRRLFVVNQLSTGILGIPLPALLSNTSVCVLPFVL